MKCFICGSSENLAKRFKLSTKARIATHGLPPDQSYCAGCISQMFHGRLPSHKDIAKNHGLSVSHINQLRERCLSFVNSGGQPSYRKLKALKGEILRVKAWSIPILRDWDQAVKRAQELSEIVNSIHSSLRFSEEAVDRMLSESYEARRAAASAFTANRDVRAFVFKRDGASCKQCGNSENPSLDHIVPVAAGGEDSVANLQVLCVSCNSSKGAK